MLTGIDLCNQMLVVVEAGHRLGKVLLLVAFLLLTSLVGPRL